eukprot:SAG31_NODE_399_length_16247_cov_19.137540_17_plen_101_part_00
MNMTKMWIRLGGRGIDTALDYANQPQVGVAMKAAIAAGMVKNRSALFVTTKISPRDCTAAAALAAVKTDVQQLGVDYVDLVLLHFPCHSGKSQCPGHTRC